MDYVVFGIGFGATLLVFGLLIRDFGSRLRFRSPAGADGVFHAEELVARVSWSRFCGALGTVWATAGLAFVVITVVCMLFMVSDARAGWVMGVSFLVLLVAMALWTWAFFDRFGSYGILPERDVVVERAAIERVPAASQDDAGDWVRDQDRHGMAASGESTEAPEQMETDHTGPDDQAVHAALAQKTEHEDAVDTSSPPTPEERLAAATSPMNHDSHEAGLDTPERANSRPTRRSFRPTPTAGATGPDAVSDSGKSTHADPEVRNEDDSSSAGTSTTTSSPLPDARPREA